MASFFPLLTSFTLWMTLALPLRPIRAEPTAGKTQANTLIAQRLEQAQEGDWGILSLDHNPLLWVLFPTPSDWLLWLEWEAPESLTKNPATEEVERWLRSPEAREQMRAYALPPERSLVWQWQGADARWEPMKTEHTLIGSLLQLHLSPVPLEDQPRIGLPSIRSDWDDRPIWKPPLSRSTGGADMWRGTWPEDGSRLGGAQISLYLPKQATDHWPPAFPLYLALERLGVRGSLSALAGGRQLNLPPPYSYLQDWLPDHASCSADDACEENIAKTSSSSIADL